MGDSTGCGGREEYKEPTGNGHPTLSSYHPSHTASKGGAW